MRLLSMCQSFFGHFWALLLLQLCPSVQYALFSVDVGCVKERSLGSVKCERIFGYELSTTRQQQQQSVDLTFWRYPRRCRGRRRCSRSYDCVRREAKRRTTIDEID